MELAEFTHVLLAPLIFKQHSAKLIEANSHARLTRFFKEIKKVCPIWIHLNIIFKC